MPLATVLNAGCDYALYKELAELFLTHGRQEFGFEILKEFEVTYSNDNEVLYNIVSVYLMFEFPGLAMATLARMINDDQHPNSFRARGILAIAKYWSEKGIDDHFNLVAINELLAMTQALKDPKEEVTCSLQLRSILLILGDQKGSKKLMDRAIHLAAQWQCEHSSDLLWELIVECYLEEKNVEECVQVLQKISTGGIIVRVRFQLVSLKIESGDLLSARQHLTVALEQFYIIKADSVVIQSELGYKAYNNSLRNLIWLLAPNIKKFMRSGLDTLLYSLPDLIRDIQESDVLWLLYTSQNIDQGDFSAAEKCARKIRSKSGRTRAICQIVEKFKKGPYSEQAMKLIEQSLEDYETLPQRSYVQVLDRLSVLKKICDFGYHPKLLAELEKQVNNICEVNDVERIGELLLYVNKMDSVGDLLQRLQEIITTQINSSNFDCSCGSCASLLAVCDDWENTLKLLKKSERPHYLHQALQKVFKNLIHRDGIGVIMQKLNSLDPLAINIARYQTALHLLSNESPDLGLEVLKDIPNLSKIVDQQEFDFSFGRGFLDNAHKSFRTIKLYFNFLVDLENILPPQHFWSNGNILTLVNEYILRHQESELIPEISEWVNKKMAVLEDDEDICLICCEYSKLLSIKKKQVESQMWADRALPFARKANDFRISEAMTNTAVAFALSGNNKKVVEILDELKTLLKQRENFVRNKSFNLNLSFPFRFTPDEEPHKGEHDMVTPYLSIWPGLTDSHFRRLTREMILLGREEDLAELIKDLPDKHALWNILTEPSQTDLPKWSADLAFLLFQRIEQFEKGEDINSLSFFETEDVRRARAKAELAKALAAGGYEEEAYKVIRSIDSCLEKEIGTAEQAVSSILCITATSCNDRFRNAAKVITGLDESRNKMIDFIQNSSQLVLALDGCNSFFGILSAFDEVNSWWVE